MPDNDINLFPDDDPGSSPAGRGASAPRSDDFGAMDDPMGGARGHGGARPSWEADDPIQAGLNQLGIEEDLDAALGGGGMTVGGGRGSFITRLMSRGAVIAGVLCVLVGGGAMYYYFGDDTAVLEGTETPPSDAELVGEPGDFSGDFATTTNPSSDPFGGDLGDITPTGSVDVTCYPNPGMAIWASYISTLKGPNLWPNGAREQGTTEGVEWRRYEVLGTAVSYQQRAADEEGLMVFAPDSAMTPCLILQATGLLPESGATWPQGGPMPIAMEAPYLVDAIWDGGHISKVRFYRPPLINP
jgi:hypothetical protein